jgi:hypothetical protein
LSLPRLGAPRGLVGIAGIAGTLLGAHFTNRAAEKRRLEEQRHDDRTRLHMEKVEIYARFITATRNYRKALSRKRSPAHIGNLNNPQQDNRDDFFVFLRKRERTICS